MDAQLQPARQAEARRQRSRGLGRARGGALGLAGFADRVGVRQAVARHRVGDDRQVLVELLLKLGPVSHIFHALVEPSREFGSDGLHRHLLVRQGGQDDQQLRRCLRRVCFVHRNLRDERLVLPRPLDVAVNLPRLGDRREVFPCYPLHLRPPHVERLFDGGNRDPAAQLRMTLGESRNCVAPRRFADPVRHVDGVKIRMRDEPVHRFEPDVVRVHVIGAFPAEFPHRLVRRRPRAGRPGANREVFAV